MYILPLGLVFIKTEVSENSPPKRVFDTSTFAIIMRLVNCLLLTLLCDYAHQSTNNNCQNCKLLMPLNARCMNICSRIVCKSLEYILNTGELYLCISSCSVSTDVQRFSMLCLGHAVKELL